MSRKNSDDSSLELLLDTMCNTFGGVMFIAILLAVTIAIKGSVPDEPPPDQTRNIEEVKQQASQLKLELENMMQSTRDQAKMLEKMQSDPRLRLINEIALIEQMYKEKQLQHKIALQNINISSAELKNLEIRALKVVEKQKITEKNLKQQMVMQEEKQKKLAELKAKIGAMNLKNMVFTTIVKKENIPYFIFVNNGMIWPVGPEISGDSYVPNAAVSHEIRDGKFFCRPVNGSGITMFAGETLTVECQQLLQKLPANRIPEFVISRSDAGDFYRLREVLKKQNVFHGFRIQPADRDYFDYQFANRSKATYEY